jgi:hypothetical protein
MEENSSQESSKKIELSQHSLPTFTSYMLEQNKVAYKFNHTIVEVAQYILKPRFKVLGISYHYCNLLQNMIPTHNNTRSELEELWSGRKPKVKHLWVFNCLVYVHKPALTRTKITQKPSKMFCGI